MDGLIDGRIYGWMDRPTYGWMGGWMDEYKDILMDGRMDY
jgi:hypothetical protein